MEEKSDCLSLEGLLSEVQLTLASKKFLLPFQRTAEAELLKLEHQLRLLFQDVSRSVLSHFEQILLNQEDKIATKTSEELLKLERQLLDLKLKQSKENTSQADRLNTLLRNIDCERERVLDLKKCSIKCDTGSLSPDLIEILVQNVEVEIITHEMSDEERIRRLAAKSQHTPLIAQPLLPRMEEEEIKKKEEIPQRKEHRPSQKGVPQGSIVLMKTLEEQPKMGFEMNTPVVITTIHKRMQGLIRKEGLRVEEVLSAKKVGEEYALKYKIITEEGWRGSVRDIEERVKKGKFVKECRGVHQKAGEGCTIF